MDKKNILIIDLSALSENQNMQHGIFDWNNCLKTMEIVHILSTIVPDGIDSLLFLSNHKIEIGTEASHNISGESTIQKWETWKLLLREYEVLKPGKNLLSHLRKKLITSRLIAVTDYTGDWLKNILPDLSNLELYIYNRIRTPKNIFEWERLLDSNKRSIYKIEKSLFAFITDELFKIVKTTKSSKPSLHFYVENILEYLDDNTRTEIYQFKMFHSGVIYICGKDGLLRKKAAEFLFDKRIKKIKYDLKDGFPLFWEETKACEVLYFRNIQSFGYQQQIHLWHTIQSFSLDKKYIIFEGFSENDLAHSLRDDIGIISVQTTVDPGKDVSDVFLHLVFEGFSRAALLKENTLLDFVAENNSFRNMLSMLKDINTIDYLLKKQTYFQSPDDLFMSDNWIRFLSDALIYEKEIEEGGKKAMSLGYFMKYRGDYWEISFGYSEPLLVKNKLGLYYIAYMMNHQGQSFSATKLRQLIQPNIKVPSADTEKNVQAIRKNINGSISHLVELENEFDLGNKFSEFLIETFIPNRLVGYKKEAKNKEEYFRDRLDKCICKFPDDINFRWEHISTPLYLKNK